MEKFSNVVKIVTVAKNVSDASRLLSLYSVKSKNKMVAFCMWVLKANSQEYYVCI